MSRRNKKTPWSMLLSVVLIFGLIIGVTYFMVNQNQQASLTGSTQLQTLVTSEFCANNPELDVDVRVDDMLSDSNAYINGSTVYVKDLADNSVTSYTITGGTTGGYTTLTGAVACGRDVGYEMFISGAGAYSSDGKIEITPADLSSETKTIKKEFEATSYTPAKVKVYDLDARTNAYDSTNSTDYVTSATSTFYSATGSTAWTIGADGFLNLEFEFAPNTTSRSKGEAMYVAVNLADDSNIDDWDENSLEITWDGQSLQEASGLSENELKALSSYEKVFYVENPIGMKGDVKDSTVKMDFYLQTGSGINADFDPVIKVVALGDFVSEDDSIGVLENVGFKDNTARSELYTAQTITLAVD